jgi:hypothetical protein
MNMKKILYFQLVILLVKVLCEGNETLPFSSINMDKDDIYVSLDLKRLDWSKLLSINNIGSDAIVNFSKKHYGVLKCDYEVECYKYNIIKNFNEVYQLFSGKKLGKTVSLELE